MGCGDLPDYYLDYIASMLNVPLTLVPGNHDLAPVCPEADRYCGVKVWKVEPKDYRRTL